MRSSPAEYPRVAIGTRVINVTFHGLGRSSQTMSRAEAAVWLPISEFELILDALVERDDVTITFDDGNASDLAIALPRLLDRGLTAKFFVLAGKLGESGYLEPADIRALAGAGMHIGSHGWAHRSWRGLPPVDIQVEMVDARKRLEEVVGTPVVEASIPFGAYDREVLGNLRATGWRRVYSSDGGPAYRDSWLQERTSMHGGLSAASMGPLLSSSGSGAAHLVRKCKQIVKRWR